MKNTIKYITLLSIGLLACEPEFDQPVEDTPAAAQENGEADFSTFVALGDSLTAGFADGALYIDGQNNSFANMMATQMQAAGGGTFTTPLMADNFGGFVDQEAFPVRLILDAVNLGPVPVNAEATTIITDVTAGPYNNTGIPGAKSFHLLSDSYGDLAGLATGTANPYFTRMASSSTSSPLADILSQSPTFFSLWIGANDVLGYATDGADPSEGDSITDIATFTGAYNLLLQNLTSNGAEGLLTNIPYVTSLPYFTTVPHNPVPLDTDTAAALNAGYSAYNQGLLQAQAVLAQFGITFTDEEIAKRTITFEAGESNAVVIFDENLTDLEALNPAFAGLSQMRQATSADLLVLPSRSLIGEPVDATDENTTIYGLSEPFADKWILTPEEQEELIEATDGYNEVISTAAEAFDLALYDAKSRVDELSDDGISVNGSLITSTYATGGFFSLDGIHLSPKGNGVTVNEMIEVINNKYGSTLEPVQTRDLPGVYIQ